jgi:hypothetical protein
MKKGVIVLLMILGILLLATGIYFTWFFTYNCSNLECFQANQVKCTKATVIRETESTTWEYTIKGESQGTCIIDTKILKVKEGQLDRKSLEGNSMECSLPIGSKVFPESDLKKCHGLLKEEIQQIIIKNAHAQIIANLGKIASELEQESIEEVI